MTSGGKAGVASLSEEEVTSLVCEYFCEGYTPAKIAEKIKSEYQIDMTREKPYKYLTDAAQKNWFRFVPPVEEALGEKVQRQYSWLADVKVVHSRTVDSIADRAAKVIFDLIRTPRLVNKNEVRIGFGGGISVSLIAKKLAVLLHEPMENFPKKIYFQSLVAGFDPSEATTDPTGFLTYILGNSQVHTQTRFIGLRAPATIKPAQRSSLLKSPGIKEARESVDKLDIIVTSAGVLSDDHSMLKNYYAKYSPNTGKFLEEKHCVGDMLWLPLCEHEPFRFDKLKGEERKQVEYRPMSVLELYELPELIKKGTEVVLCLGPCPVCHKDKTKILSTILNQDKHLITRLITDIQTTTKLLGKI